MQVIDADKLRRARIRKDWSQRTLAVLCKRSQMTIYRIETGKRDTIDEKFAMTLARLLDVNPEDVFADLPTSRVADRSG